MGSPAADLRKQLDQQTRELAEAQKHLAEALEQQAATSEILRVIPWTLVSSIFQGCILLILLRNIRL